ncbi:hypothetical protein [Paraglaciecola sp.]|uniref:hypothetical protein n=1 Tax=Paraglaciecola sp. TaxID=1920173 RepID=UPI0027401FA0|nr:hypothetical protein [Paraglaciecola sp.]MDP5032324.1 hypothetical protein [Paraglaciecola sp.]
MIIKKRSFTRISKPVLMVSFLLGLTNCLADSAPTQLLLPKDEQFNFEYLGAFRFSTEMYGSSRMAYANGTFAISPDGKSVFVAGHEQLQSIAEFLIPELHQSDDPTDLIIASNIQPFSPFLKNGKRLKNPQKLDRITGMEIIEGELFVNAVEYYDAPGDNKHTTFIVRNANDLAKSKVDGFFSMQGYAHSAGWITKLPQKWRQTFSATYLNGYAGNYAINSRLSMGPSAFISNLDTFAGINESSGLIPTRTLMNFSIKQPMIDDLYNESGKNNIWTEVSNAYYGFILPNKDYYLVIGNSGGHESKIGYKAKQTNGHQCGGPCAFNPNDYYNFYWVFDVNDFVAVQQGKKKPHELLPVSYGKLNLPFAPKNKTKNTIGADFDEVNGILFIMLEDVDSSQSQFEKAPVMLAYKLLP